METNSQCHSCGTEVRANARRCPNCYVALGAASRAPSPLRAAPSAPPLVDGQLALAPAPIADDHQVPLPVGIRCPACETTVMPLAAWCSYCLEPLPVDSLDVSVIPPELDLVEDTSGLALPEGGRVIPGPWPAHAADVTYAAWHQRAAAAAIDASVFLIPLVAMLFSATLGLVLFVVAVAFSAWQMCLLQGRTGQTIGKRRAGISLVRESDLAPVGVGTAALRQVAHGIDAGLLGVGFLWPLWDAKRQTFADQLCATVVVTSD